METKTNNIFIGLVISGLLSLFVNFPMLTRSYEVLMGRADSFPSSPEQQYMLYFGLCWFFGFALILFMINSQSYKLGNRLFHGSEFASFLFVLILGILAGLILYRLFPIVRQFVLGDILGFDLRLNDRPFSHEMPGHPVFPGLGKHGGGNGKGPFPFRFPFLPEHLFVILVVILSTFLLNLLHSKQQMSLAYEKLKTEKLQTSYNALMGQINPHFFFNSLNGLSSLIRQQKQEQTLIYLDELSNVFRYILQSNSKEMVTLAEELQFVKAYTYLLQVRYEGKFDCSIQASPELLLYRLPILSILPLLENAVKHNVISRQYPLQIDIYTTSDLKVVVSNRIQPKRDEPESGGLGLRNLWGRYRMLTGKDIEISNRKEYFKVALPLLGSTDQVKNT